MRHFRSPTAALAMPSGSDIASSSADCRCRSRPLDNRSPDGTKPIDDGDHDELRTLNTESFV